MNNKGQSVLSEHVMVFFVVIAALVALTTYAQRAFEARINDAKNYAIDSVNKACDANCQLATGNHIAHEYEPYYSVVDSYVTQNEQELNSQTNGSAEGIGAIYYHTKNDTTQVISTSAQLPPVCAGAPNGNCLIVPKEKAVLNQNGYDCSKNSDCVSGYCNASWLCATQQVAP